MRLDEILKENQNIPRRFEVTLPVVYRDNLFRLFRKLGMAVLDDKPGANNSWTFVIDNKFGKDSDTITDIIGNNLKYQGKIEIKESMLREDDNSFTWQQLSELISDTYGEDAYHILDDSVNDYQPGKGLRDKDDKNLRIKMINNALKEIGAKFKLVNIVYRYSDIDDGWNSNIYKIMKSAGDDLKGPMTPEEKERERARLRQHYYSTDNMLKHGTPEAPPSAKILPFNKKSNVDDLIQRTIEFFRKNKFVDPGENFNGDDSTLVNMLDYPHDNAGKKIKNELVSLSDDDYWKWFESVARNVWPP